MNASTIEAIKYIFKRTGIRFNSTIIPWYNRYDKPLLKNSVEKYVNKYVKEDSTVEELSENEFKFVYEYIIGWWLFYYEDIEEEIIIYDRPNIDDIKTVIGVLSIYDIKPFN